MRGHGGSLRTGTTVLAAVAALLAAVPIPALAEAPPASGLAPAPAPDTRLADLAALMAGSYSSAEQAAADPQNYRDIRLVMVPVWKDRADGPWLYVEQAAATSLDKPYRQRVYQLVRTGPETIESRVYTLPDPPAKYAGAAEDPARPAGLEPGALSLRAGCAVVLKKSGPVWTGSTVGKECGSDLRGAAYATSEVTIGVSTLESWDRGYDAADKQAWGAEKGPYIFVRQ